MHHTHKYSQHSPIIWPVWLNGWVFVYEWSGCGFESNCSHLNFRHRTCFEQGVPWHSGSYRIWIHSEMRTWLDKNIKLYLILYRRKWYRNSFFVELFDGGNVSFVILHKLNKFHDQSVLTSQVFHKMYSLFRALAFVHNHVHDMKNWALLFFKGQKH